MREDSARSAKNGKLGKNTEEILHEIAISQRRTADVQSQMVQALLGSGSSVPVVPDYAVPPEGVMPPNENAKWLSPEGAQILSALTDEYQAARKIAHALGWTESVRENAPQKLYILLNEYVARGLVQKDDDGYRLWVEESPVGSGNNSP
jgi:hypothetical protein